MDISSDAYQNEPVRYPALTVVDLKAEGAKVEESYRNMVINRVNGSCLRLAAFEDDYVWHYHRSRTNCSSWWKVAWRSTWRMNERYRLRPWESVTIPAKTIHRTRALGRTVNLCFEELGAETVFVERKSDNV